MVDADLLLSTPAGLYCPAGDFHIDPLRPVAKAVITHAHSDHALPGCGSYLAAEEGLAVLRARIGTDAVVEGLPYGQRRSVDGVIISLHPAGHILGSAQVRIERGGEVWIVTGDYKLAADATCQPFELLQCHTLVTESTFGLPIYRWPAPDEIFAEINTWWRANAAAGLASMVYAYSLGKGQRLIAGLDSSIGPIYCHGAVERFNAIYRSCGVALPETNYTGQFPDKRSWPGALIVAPTSARGSPWLRRFGEFSSAFVSGWMQVRGARRRRAVDRGFALSDHADWPALVAVVRGSSAERVLVTHGFVDPLVRWLRENGWQAAPLQTEFRGELEEQDEPAGEPEPEGEPEAENDV